MINKTLIEEVKYITKLMGISGRKMLFDKPKMRKITT